MIRSICCCGPGSSSIKPDSVRGLMISIVILSISGRGTQDRGVLDNPEYPVSPARVYYQ